MARMELIAFRITSGLRDEMRRIIRRARDEGREMNESVFIRTALRLHIRRENEGRSLPSPGTKEEIES